MFVEADNAGPGKLALEIYDLADFKSGREKSGLAVRHGFEPTFRAFSPLPMIASSCVFIAFQYTQTINVCKHFMCICGKRREEKRVQIVCKEDGCANFVQN